MVVCGVEEGCEEGVGRCLVEERVGVAIIEEVR